MGGHDTNMNPKLAFALRCLNCLGVVYGDIGTSPLYVYKGIFADEEPTEKDVLGILCLIFYSITLVVTFKYLIFILKADFKGEGGTFALLSLLLYDPNKDEDVEEYKKSRRRFRSKKRQPVEDEGSGELRVPNDNNNVDLPRTSLELTTLPSPPRRSVQLHRDRADSAARVSFEEAEQPRVSVEEGYGNGEFKMEMGSASFDKTRPSVDNPFASKPMEFDSIQNLHKSPFLRKKRVTTAVSVAAIMASSLLLGDGVITPAISVLSSIEGLKLVSTKLEPAIVPITIFVLLVLFSCQRFGTAKIGIVFGPIMCVWFLAIFMIGVYRMSEYPKVWAALNPAEGFSYFTRNGRKGWSILGSVVLCITGGEAMFADMGHFGVWPVRVSWLFLVYPSVLMSYLGQGAMLINNPELRDDPFYHSVPKALFWPMFILATLATVIASQALISGSFSIIQQAIRMKIFPKIQIVHTSSSTEGQIYIPALNYLLAIMCIILVAAFQSSEALGALYGLAVCGDMTFTTVFYSILSLLRWRWHFVPWLLMVTEFLIVDLSFLSAALLKVPQGAWVTIVFSAFMFSIMFIWRRGKLLVRRVIHEQQMSLGTLMRAAESQNLKRFDRVGVYLTSVSHGVPSSLLELIEHSPFLQSTVIFLTIKHARVPFVNKKYRLEVIPLKMNGCYRVLAHVGYRESFIDVPALIAECQSKIPDVKYLKTSFFVANENLIVNANSHVLRRLFYRIFVFLQYNSYKSVNEFHLTSSQTVTLGQDIIL